MGLTVGWKLRLRAKRNEGKAVAARLEAVRQVCLDLPFAEVGKVQHVPERVCKLGYEHKSLDEDLAWAMIQAQKWIHGRRVGPSELFRLSLWAGEGCESTELTLCRYPRSRIWTGRGFTKTQYATHFVSAHLLVISALDACREAGILKSVNDNGNYWKTRDLKVLAGNINEYTDLVKSIGGMLKGAGWKDMQIKSAVDTCANYMSVE